MDARTVWQDVAITPAALLQHWQGHRRLTRRVIESFPADQLFRFSLGGMRSFGLMAVEMLDMAVPMVQQLVAGGAGESGRFASVGDAILGGADPRVELLRRWDEATATIDEAWSTLPPGRLQEALKVFGSYEGRGSDLLLYVIDNEIHHRGQGYVYLRALGVEPPRFWERG